MEMGRSVCNEGDGRLNELDSQKTNQQHVAFLKRENSGYVNKVLGLVRISRIGDAPASGTGKTVMRLAASGTNSATQLYAAGG